MWDAFGNVFFRLSDAALLDLRRPARDRLVHRSWWPRVACGRRTPYTECTLGDRKAYTAIFCFCAVGNELLFHKPTNCVSNGKHNRRDY